MQSYNNRIDDAIHESPYDSPVKYPHGIMTCNAENMMEGVNLISTCLRAGYDIVALDTEFPGIYFFNRTVNTDNNKFQSKYNDVKDNTDALEPIQIGFSFHSTKLIAEPPLCTAVQFNLKWSKDSNNFSKVSIKMLERAGFDFQKQAENGIERDELAYELLSIDMVKNESLKWITYHGYYDCAYMIKILSGESALKDKLSEFLYVLNIYFPTILDLKTIASENDMQYSGGLQGLAKLFGISFDGQQHQAAADAIVTGKCYLELFRRNQLNGNVLIDEHKNSIYGLNYEKRY